MHLDDNNNSITEFFRGIFHHHQKLPISFILRPKFTKIAKNIDSKCQTSIDFYLQSVIPLVENNCFHWGPLPSSCKCNYIFIHQVALATRQ